MLPHNKIIKTTVKKFLEPEKLFQIGSSRSWLDDQGYYMILVEFASRETGKKSFRKSRRISKIFRYGLCKILFAGAS